MNISYFEYPTQVLFVNPEDGEPKEWLCGIAYRDEIICGCCGGIFKIEKVIKNNKKFKHAIHIYFDWNDISQEIVGGELPESLYFLNDGELGEYEHY